MRARWAFSPRLYACKFQCRPVLFLKPIAQALLAVHIDAMGGNRLRLDRMEFGGILEPILELPPCRGCLPFLSAEPHSAVVHHLLRCPLASIRSLVDGVLD